MNLLRTPTFSSDGWLTNLLGRRDIRIFKKVVLVEEASQYRSPCCRKLGSVGFNFTTSLCLVNLTTCSVHIAVVDLLPELLSSPLGLPCPCRVPSPSPPAVAARCRC